MASFKDFEADAKAASVPNRPECSVGALLKTLAAPDRKQVEGALRNQALTASGLRVALAARLGDSAPGVSPLRRHRKGDCQCDTAG